MKNRDPRLDIRGLEALGSDPTIVVRPLEKDYFFVGVAGQDNLN
jgi:hypothetical protein